VVYVVLVVVAVLIGTVLAPVAWGVASQATQSQSPTVAVVSISGPITGSTASQVVEDLRETRQNSSVEAVVIKVNSPGGSASASEQLYMAVNRTAAEMPVVAAVSGVSASGSYYAIAPADDIYVTPASVVGSVGAFATVQSPSGARGEIIRSGPDKATQTREQIKNQLETIQRSFVGTIMTHRGDELNISRDQLAHAKVYTGAVGIQNGLADRIGDVNSAVDRAATMADLDSQYTVDYKEPPVISVSDIFGKTDGERVVVDDEQFGFEGVDTTVYFTMWGVPETDDNEVMVNATG